MAGKTLLLAFTALTLTAAVPAVVSRPSSGGPVAAVDAQVRPAATAPRNLLPRRAKPTASPPIAAVRPRNVMQRLENAAGTLVNGGRAPGWQWPLRPRPVVVTGFRVGPHRWSPGHRGVDLRPVGDPVVRAAREGIVSYANRLANRGVVVIKHDNGIRTTYEPVTAWVKVGQQVQQGEPIGTLATAGEHCRQGLCVHWGAIRGQAYINPLTLVRDGYPILLPLSAPGSSSASASASNTTE